MTTTPVPTCTDDLLAEIERAANAEYLTEGEWKSSTDDGGGEPHVVYVDIPGGVSVLFESDWATQTDAELVALCSPANIRALLARLHAAERDAGRLQWMIDEECQVYGHLAQDGVRYGIVWPNLGESQVELFATPREAIDAAMEAVK